jgi:hypothetical protein
MKVPFYGHVRQYHNLKAEIDTNIQTVLESGEYVLGPMLKRFELNLPGCGTNMPLALPTEPTPCG